MLNDRSSGQQEEKLMVQNDDKDAYDGGYAGAYDGDYLECRK